MTKAPEPRDIDFRRSMTKPLPDGVPCKHPGCLSHISHPCEGCGRIGGVAAPLEPTPQQETQAVLDFFYTWSDHSEDFEPDADSVKLAIAYAAAVKEGK
jgi:hypothetical protein